MNDLIYFRASVLTDVALKAYRNGYPDVDVTVLVLNKGLKLDVASHVMNLDQSECIISQKIK